MGVKRYHEVRDPIHGFIDLDRRERSLVDSLPFQRLRHITQLSTTYLVYPGATHKSFEHSLGVMSLAKKVFDVVVSESKVHPKIEHILPDKEHLPYWRSVLALAALAHDIGHIPFSHAAEKTILPRGKSHEDLTISLLKSDQLSNVWEKGHHIHVDDVVKLAVGPKKLKGVSFTTWESLMSEIIVGDSFGVDRMDYLLRDAYHAGVGYGRFDYLKLIESLRILPASLTEGESSEPQLGVDFGGLHSAEALLLARYFMYEQVYFHPIRRIYDMHLIEFMEDHYGMEGYFEDIEFHLSQTDNEVMAAIWAARTDRGSKRALAARALTKREHFRTIYLYNPSDQAILQEALISGRIKAEVGQPFNSPAYLLWIAVGEEFGKENVRKDLYIQDSAPSEFPVLMPDGRIESSLSASRILANFPLMTVDSIYGAPNIAEQARGWIEENRPGILGL